MRRVPVFLLCVALAACAGEGNSADSQPADAATAETPAANPAAGATAGSCTEGTWEMVENGATKSFTFRADKTGEEISTPPDASPLTWSMKDDKTVHIVYTAQGDVQSTEWDLNVDCQANTLSFYGATYKKK